MLKIIIIQIGHVKIYRSLRRDTSLSSNYRSLRFQRINIFQFYLGEIVYNKVNVTSRRPYAKALRGSPKKALDFYNPMKCHKFFYRNRVKTWLNYDTNCT